MSKLKPCPFCGNKSVSMFNAVGEYWVHCEENKCPRMRCCDTDAAESWNTRPLEDAKDAEIERLKEENIELKKICDYQRTDKIYMRGWNDGVNMITKQFQDYATRILKETKK